MIVTLSRMQVRSLAIAVIIGGLLTGASFAQDHVPSQWYCIPEHSGGGWTCSAAVSDCTLMDAALACSYDSEVTQYGVADGAECYNGYMHCWIN